MPSTSQQFSGNSPTAFRQLPAIFPTFFTVSTLLVLVFTFKFMTGVGAFFSFLNSVVAAVQLDIIFLAGVAVLGLVAVATGSWFTYQAHFQHPKFSYIPVDKEWQQHLGSLVERAQLASQLASAGTTNESSSSNQSSNDGQQPVPTCKPPASHWVDVSGAVSRPGVYEVEAGSRWQDIILKAGGFSPLADQQFIHQQLNLSLQVSDQDKLYIPLQGEDVEAAAGYSHLQSNADNNSATSKSSSGKTSGSDESESAVAIKPLNVNLATQSQLEELPNIGEKRASDIISNRPYSSNQDFIKRSGLSTNLAQELTAEMIYIE